VLPTFNLPRRLPITVSSRCMRSLVCAQMASQRRNRSLSVVCSARARARAASISDSSALRGMFFMAVAPRQHSP
jgi:hypothetical protein